MYPPPRRGAYQAAITSGPTVAAHYTIHATLRKAGPVTTEVRILAIFTDEGRAHRITQITRTLPTVRE